MKCVLLNTATDHLRRLELVANDSRGRTWWRLVSITPTSPPTSYLLYLDQAAGVDWDAALAVELGRV